MKRICVICGVPALKRLRAATCGSPNCQYKRRLKMMKKINRKKYRDKVKTKSEDLQEFFQVRRRKNESRKK